MELQSSLFTKARYLTWSWTKLIQSTSMYIFFGNIHFNIIMHSYSTYKTVTDFVRSWNDHENRGRVIITPASYSVGSGFKSLLGEGLSVNWIKPRKTSVRITGLRTEIWTRDFPNVKQECSSASGYNVPSMLRLDDDSLLVSWVITHPGHRL
jgi:hypothetical protein